MGKKGKLAISHLLASIILIGLVLVGGIVTFVILNGVINTEAKKTQVNFEYLGLYKSIGDPKIIFSATLKNTGNKPIKILRIKLHNETEYVVPSISAEHPLAPGRGVGVVLTPEKTPGYIHADWYVIGLHYSVQVRGVATDESSFSHVTTVICLGQQGGEEGEQEVSVIYLYTGGASPSGGGRIVRINLNTFEVDSTKVELPNDVFGEVTFEKDDTYLYAAPRQAVNQSEFPPIPEIRIIRITLEPFEINQNLSIPLPAEFSGLCVEDMLIVNNFLYVALYNEFTPPEVTKILKIDLNLFQLVDELETPDGIYGLTSLASDGTYLYSGTYTGEILKIDLATFTITDTLTLPDNPFVASLALEDTNLFVGVGTLNNVIFYRIDLTTFSVAESVTAPETGTNPLPEALHIVGDYLYATCRQGVKRLYKLTKSPLSIVDSMSLGGRDVWDLAHYGDFLYVSSIDGGTSDNYINKIGLADFTSVDELMLEPEERVEHIII